MSQEMSPRTQDTAKAPFEPAKSVSQPLRPAELTRARTIREAILLRFSTRQIVLALGIAAASDVLCAFLLFAPPVVWAIDLATALLLFTVLGWHWIYLPGLLMEAIPGFGIFPFWLLVVIAVFIWGTPRPNLRRKQ